MRNIKPTNNNGSIQLKFSVGGKRYNFNPFAKSAFTDRRDIVKAGGVANQIEMDILAGCFDKTLDRYREKPKVPEVASVKPSRVLYQFPQYRTKGCKRRPGKGFMRITTFDS